MGEENKSGSALKKLLPALERYGKTDSRHRLRCPPPSKEWHLMDVIEGLAELEEFVLSKVWPFAAKEKLKFSTRFLCTEGWQSPGLSETAPPNWLWNLLTSLWIEG